MPIEQKRGCGYRKAGGVYLMGEGLSTPCDRLPLEIKNCPVCGSGIKFSRGFQWLDFKRYANNHNPCRDSQSCFVCYPRDGLYGLMWVGNMYYTPESFIEEANRQGVCKKIANVPKKLKLGKTIILLAHRKAFTKEVEDKNTLTGVKLIKTSGIFYAFIPTRIEKIVTNIPDDKTIRRYNKRGISLMLAKKVDKEGNVLETEEIKNKEKF